MSGDPFVPEHDPVGANEDRLGVVEGVGEGNLLCANHHAERAEWFCDTCGKGLCEACVRVYAAKDQRHASCRACGSRCRPLLDRFVDPDNRAGAIESPEQRRQRIMRDVHLPAGVLVGSLVLATVTMGMPGSILPGLFGGLVIIAVSTATIGFGYWLLCRMLGSDFGPLEITWLKMAAIAAAINLVRNFCWVTLVGYAGTGGMAAGLAMLLPTGVSFVLAPMVAISLLVTLLFEHDMYERSVSIVAIFVFEAMGIFVVLMNTYEGGV